MGRSWLDGFAEAMNVPRQAVQEERERPIWAKILRALCWPFRVIGGWIMYRLWKWIMGYWRRR